MTENISLRIDANDTRLRVRLDGMPKLVQQRIKAQITRLVNELLPQVIAAEPYVTGRLRSLTHAYVDERDGFVRGRVRVLRTYKKNVAAAAGALEYGAPGRRGRFQVNTYTMRRTQAFGSLIQPSRQVSVKSYFRTQKLHAMRFLRGPGAAMLPRARIELQQALDKIAQEMSSP